MFSLASVQNVKAGFFFSSRRRHTSSKRDWSSDVCSSDLGEHVQVAAALDVGHPGALGLGGDDRQRMVVVRAVLVAELEQAGGGLGHEPRVRAIGTGKH